MTIDKKSNTYNDFMAWAKRFSAQVDVVPMDGEIYDMAGTVVYKTARHKLSTGGRIEAHVVTPEAQSQFSWVVEITIDDVENSLYKHVLLQSDGTIVETYGKTVISVDEHGAESLLTDAKRLTTAIE